MRFLQRIVGPDVLTSKSKEDSMEGNMSSAEHNVKEAAKNISRRHTEHDNLKS